MEAVIAANPDVPQVAAMRLSLADRYFDEGSFSSALPHYLGALEGTLDSTRRARGLARIGWMSYLSGAEDIAEAYLLEALDIDPDYRETHLFLGLIRLYQGDGSGALARLEPLLAGEDLPGDTRRLIEDAVAEARGACRCRIDERRPGRRNESGQPPYAGGGAGTGRPDGSGVRFQVRKRDRPGYPTGHRAPRFPIFPFPTWRGRGMVDLRTLADQHDVLVLNFFASWCLQCRNEHADLISTADAYRDRSVRFVGIAFQDRPDLAVAFLDELGRGTAFDYVLDPGSRAAIEFGIFGVPETVFISDGAIVGKLLGESDALTLSGAIEQILSGEAVGARQVGEYRQGPDDRG